MFFRNRIFSETYFHGKYYAGFGFQRNMIFAEKYVSELILFLQNTFKLNILPKLYFLF